MVAALQSEQANDTTRTLFVLSANQLTGREIKPADQPELAVGDVEAVLNRLGENRQELAVKEVQDVDETENAEHQPSSPFRPSGWGFPCRPAHEIGRYSPREALLRRPHRRRDRVRVAGYDARASAALDGKLLRRLLLSTRFLTPHPAIVNVSGFGAHEATLPLPSTFTVECVNLKN